MKLTYTLLGLMMAASPVAAEDPSSLNDMFIEDLKNFTAVASYIAVDNKVILDDPTKNGKPVFILAGSPQVDFGGRVGYLAIANVVLVGKSCAKCTVSFRRYPTGGEFDNFIVEFSEP